MIFQAVLSIGGFFQDTSSCRHGSFSLVQVPALALIILYFISARGRFISNLPLRILTIIHVVRIPVELVLHWFYEGGMVPEVMTFHGTNFDIISGITAPVIYYFAFRAGSVNRPLLIVWNILAFCLVLNIVVTAVLCVPSPIQMLAFDQPNHAVLFFPYIWLPTIVVPIVFLCHAASLWQLLGNKAVASR